MSDTTIARDCPQCGTAMSHHNLEDLHLDLCDACGGIWYDAGQFTRLLKDGASEVAGAERLEPPLLKPLDHPATLSCPLDALPLHHSLFKGHPGVEIATCYECGGIFMPANSLKQLDTLENKPGGLSDVPQLSPEEIAQIGQMDAQAAADIYRAKLACYTWGGYDHSAAWSAMNLLR